MTRHRAESGKCTLHTIDPFYTPICLISPWILPDHLPLIIPSYISQSPTSPPWISKILMFLLFAPSYQLRSPDDRLQSCVWSSSMTHQSVTGDFWSLALSPLSLVHHCVLVYRFPLLISFYLEISGSCSDNLNEADALTFHTPLQGVHTGFSLSNMITFCC